MPPRAAARMNPLETQARVALRDSARTLARIERENAPAVAVAAEMLIGCFRDGCTVFFCGNGGSAADAQHLAAEFSGRYLVDRPGLPAVALTANSSAVTAIGNDYGYDEVFARQLEGIGKPGDVLVAITTSGRSESIRNAVRAAQELDMRVIGMTGPRGAEFAAMCDVALVTPAGSTPNIQEGHIAMGHAFCLLVERTLFPEATAGQGPKPAGVLVEPADTPAVSARAEAAKPAPARSAKRKPAGKPPARAAARKPARPAAAPVRTRGKSSVRATRGRA